MLWDTNPRKIRWRDAAQKHIPYLSYNTNGGAFKELGQTGKWLTFTLCAVPVEAGQTGALQLCSILTWGSTPGVRRAPQRRTLGYGWGTEGGRLSCACMLSGFEVQPMFGCSCMTNLRPIHPHQFHLNHSCGIHLLWKMLLTLITAEPFVARQASAASIPCNSTVAHSMNAVTNYREKWICFAEQGWCLESHR